MKSLEAIVLDICKDKYKDFVPNTQELKTITEYMVKYRLYKLEYSDMEQLVCEFMEEAIF